MALKPDTNATMSGRITAADANYPHGSSKDETAPGAGDGTPYFKARADDIFGMQQALLLDGDVTPSGNADTAVLSDYLQAASNVLKQGGFKNRFINGDFSVTQRGASFINISSLGGSYTADQWEYNVNLDGGALSANDVTISPFAAGQVDVPGNPRNFATVGGAIAGGSGSENLVFLNKIEDVRSFSGEQVTLSFWVKGSITASAGVYMVQSFGSGGSPSAGVNALPAQALAVTTSWVRHTITFDVASIAGKTLGSNEDHFFQFGLIKQAGATVNATWGGTGSIAYAGTIDIADVQIEKGRYASRFERLQPAQALSLCRRYYRRYDYVSAGALLVTNFTWNHSTSNYVVGFLASNAFRTEPTVNILTATGSYTTVGVTGTSFATVPSTSVSYSGPAEAVIISFVDNSLPIRSSATLDLATGIGNALDFELTAEL